MPKGGSPGPAAVQVELCIRLAQSVAQLNTLPEGLTERVGVQAAIDLYADSIMDIEKADCSSQDWVQTLMQAHQLHSAVLRLLLRESHAYLAEFDGDLDAMRERLDSALEAFNSTHKSVEFLTKHVLQSQQGGAGAVRNVRVGHVARDAAKSARAICMKAMGKAPAIDVEVNSDDGLMYDPDILRYTLVELFKNACKASVEKGSALPRVRCVVESLDDSFLAVRIVDRGVGIGVEDKAKIWSYTFSTSKSANSAGVTMGDQQALAGFGVGLPFSRICARHFGGDLTLKSVQGRGTEVCLRLDRASKREHLSPTASAATTNSESMGSLGEFLDWQAAANFHEALDTH